MNLKQEDIDYFTKLLMMYGRGVVREEWQGKEHYKRLLTYQYNGYMYRTNLVPLWASHTRDSQFQLTDKAIAAIKEWENGNETN